MTALEDNREAMLLGQAFRRVQRVLPDGWGIAVHPQPAGQPFAYLAGVGDSGIWRVTAGGDTPTEALDALAAAAETEG